MEREHSRQASKPKNGFEVFCSPAEPKTLDQSVTSVPVIVKKSPSRFSPKDLATLAMLGALWGVLEVELGTLLQVLGIPFWGALLTSMGVVILLVGRAWVPNRGTALLMGGVVVFLKMVFLGAVAIKPVLGIVIESVLVELGLFWAQPRKPNFLLAGALGVSWALFHPFFALGLLSGWGILKVYVFLGQWGAKVLNTNPANILIMFLLLIVAHALMGLIAGTLGWQAAAILSRRMNSRGNLVNAEFQRTIGGN